MRKYGGNVIYLSKYIDITDPLWTQSDSDIYKLFCKGLSSMYPDFKMSDVKDWRLTRTRGAQPVIERNYSKYKPSINTPESGLFLSGTAQIYPEDRGMNYAVRLADETSTAVKEYLSLMISENDSAKSTSGYDAAENEFVESTTSPRVIEKEYAKTIAVPYAANSEYAKSFAMPDVTENEFSKNTSMPDIVKRDFESDNTQTVSGDKVFTLDTASNSNSNSNSADGNLKVFALSDSTD
jgi:hypothetical protein